MLKSTQQEALTVTMTPKYIKYIHIIASGAFSKSTPVLMLVRCTTLRSLHKSACLKKVDSRVDLFLLLPNRGGSGGLHF